jgi:hypothetical protein
MSGSTEYRTPKEEFLPLHAEFGFNVDAAAAPENALLRPHDLSRQHGHHKPVTPAKVGDWCLYCGGSPLDEHNILVGRFYTSETDGTKREHYGAGDVVWCNPPYSPGSLVDAFVETAAWTSKNVGALWVMLLNSSMTATARWHDHIWDRELHRFRDRVQARYPDHRIAFLRPDGKKSIPRYDNMLIIFRPPLEAAK